MKTILLHLWQLPQHIAAWLLISMLWPTRCCTYLKAYKNRRVYVYPLKRPVCLGQYIFASANDANYEARIAHEYGHSVQSLILGPLYLIAIGIVSACIPYSSIRYYSVYTERWANHLGGVKVVKTGPLSCHYELRLKS